jgi:hypothetical protein
MFVDLLLVVGGPGTEFWRAGLAWVVGSLSSILVFR